ncbi:SRPBCC family protein [Pseudonocardia adelaidensis]|uniref:SRPBCC family protein n=1 Tax=Pseudonocardia adelaidensis TaxID=648754 RepID=A0ABP9NIA1_9PSEU
MFDVDPQITAVRRQVGRRALDEGDAAVVTISQAYDTDVDDLWEACTNSERLARWFAPVSGELRVGGRYQIEGNAAGTVEQCDPPKSFSATWEFAGGVSWIEVRFSPEPGGGSRFELDHIAHMDEHWAEFGPGAVGLGYDLSLLGLAAYLATGDLPHSEQRMAWLASEDAKRFLREAAERWYEADVAGGTSPETARGAADRCAAAYTA